MGKFSKKSTPTKTINKAGGFAYKLDVKTELVHAVLTTFLEDKFYESGSERLERIKDLVSKNKPQFVANLAVVARTEFNLRSVVTVLIGELAKIHRGDSLVKDTIVNATVRVDDLTELVAYVGTPLPKQVKRGVRNALLKFNRYQLAKYKGEGNEVSLIDLFNLTHPKAQHANKEQKKAWKDLMEGNLKSFDTWETEVANTTNPKKTWSDLVLEKKLGYMALLRNLNNLVKNKVSDAVIDSAVEQLTDEKAVKKSRQLPFRFVNAFDNVEGNRKFTRAISDAMDIAVSNCPTFKGKTLIAIDGSGSMAGDAIKKASIFAATLFKSHVNSDVVMFSDKLMTITINDNAPVINLAKDIERSIPGGGTNTSLVFKYVEQEKKAYNRIIIISDDESWQDSAWGGHGTNTSLTNYKKVTGEDPYIFCLDVAGYGTKDINAPKVKHIAGWSDKIFDFINAYEKGDALIKYIEDFTPKSKELEDAE